MKKTFTLFKKYRKHTFLSECTEHQSTLHNPLEMHKRRNANCVCTYCTSNCYLFINENCMKCINVNTYEIKALNSDDDVVENQKYIFVSKKEKKHAQMEHIRCTCTLNLFSFRSDRTNVCKSKMKLNLYQKKRNKYEFDAIQLNLYPFH